MVYPLDYRETCSLIRYLVDSTQMPPSLQAWVSRAEDYGDELVILSLFVGRAAESGLRDMASMLPAIVRAKSDMRLEVEEMSAGFIECLYGSDRQAGTHLDDDLLRAARALREYRYGQLDRS